MTEQLRTAIQEAFAGAYTIADLAELYAEIRLECKTQLEFMAEQITDEARDKNNG